MNPTPASRPHHTPGSDRRSFLRAALLGGGALLAACSETASSGAPATSTPAAGAPTSAPVPTAPATTAPATTAPATSAPATTALAPTELALPARRQAASTFLSGNFAPVPETTAWQLRVDGQLPSALSGNLFRNGPNPIAPDLANPSYSWFSGEGMTHSVALADGAATSYHSRMVRTGPVAATIGEAAVGGPAPLPIDLANVSVVSCFGRILATCEGAVPYEIDRSVNTLGRFDFGGGLTNGLSAHPKWDPARQELHHMSYAFASTPYLVWQVIDGTGRIVRTTPIDVPASTMVHTMSITERHVLVYDLPVELNAEMIAGGWAFPYGWNASRPARIGVLSRDTDAPIRWIEIEPCAVFHDQGARDLIGPDGSVTGIEVIVPVYARVFDRVLGGPIEAPGYLERWTIDLVGGSLTRTQLDDRSHEFPRVNETLGIAAPRYLYTIAATAAGALALDGAPNLLAKTDLQTGTTQTVSLGSTSNTGEAVFVADPARTADEDGGWLLSFVYDFDTDASRIAVVDAQDLTAGEVASVHLPGRVPYGFHATWVPN